MGDLQAKRGIHRFPHIDAIFTRQLEKVQEISKMGPVPKIKLSGKGLSHQGFF